MVLAGALAFALCAGVCGAEDEGDKISSGSMAATQGTEDSAGFEDTDSGNKPVEPDAEVGVMSPGQSYDENTGLPDTVESDSDMDL